MAATSDVRARTECVRGTNLRGSLESLLGELASTPNKFQAHAAATLKYAERKPELRKALAEAKAARTRARIHEAVAQARARAELDDQSRDERTVLSDRSDGTATTDLGSTTSVTDSHHTDTSTPDGHEPASTKGGVAASEQEGVRDDIRDVSTDGSKSTRSALERSITFAGDDLHSQRSDTLEPGPMTRRMTTFTWNGPLKLTSGGAVLETLGESEVDDVGLNNKLRHAQDGLAQWPSDVRDALNASDIVIVAQRTLPPTPAPVNEGSRMLRVVGAGYSIPHPEKGVGNDGADSFYMDSASNSMGVADGVGEWEWRFKCSARAFADELMEGCRQAARTVDATASKDLGAAAMEMLRYGHSNTRSFGAATALVAKLGNENNRNMGVACLGDAALIQLRHETVGQHATFRCVSRTREQQHAFNCPFQLSRLPVTEDFPQLLREGKVALVRAVERMRKGAVKQDQPEDAEASVFQVQRGDLIVLGTDGLFDNLYDQEICHLADCAVSPLEVHGLGGEQCAGGSQRRFEEELTARLASALAKAAFNRSTSRSGKTPFGDHARQVGMYHTGGKMDDISCVCAWIV